MRFGVGVADVPGITDETLHRGRHHRLPTSDHDEHLVAGDAHFALDVANKLAAIDVEKRLGVRQRIPAEFLTQPYHRRAQAVQGRTGARNSASNLVSTNSPQVTSSSRVRSTRITGG
jgi:hypothetical protein